MDKPKNNQQTFRATGHLGEVANKLREKYSAKDNGVIHRAACRYLGLNPNAIIHEIRLSEEPQAVQDIVDQMIAEQHKSGVIIDDLAKPAWMTAAIAEARARSLRQRDRYWVILGKRRFGPHLLDLIRLWVAQEIVGQDWLIQPENSSLTTAIGLLPGFWPFPDDVNSELKHIRTRIDAISDEAPTRKQMAKLEFFGLPYAEGIRRARASEILDVWMVLDPATERQWEASKDRKP